MKLFYKTTKNINLMKRIVTFILMSFLLFDTCIFDFYTINAKEKKEETSLTDFNLSDVLVTDEYYSKSFDLEVTYLTSLDTDKLLAGFRETAAYACGMSEEQTKKYMNNAIRYQNTWESHLIGGHTLGHYMTACAQSYSNPQISATDKTKIKNILDTIITSLADCQQKTKNSSICKYGYLFGGELRDNKKTNLEFQFDNVEKSKTNIFNEAWVPWYTMHKIMAGLISVYNLTDDTNALNVAITLGEWVYNRTSSWSEQTCRTVLYTEYGGMNDCMYDLYIAAKENNYTNSEHFVKAAHSFDEENLFILINSGKENALNNRHANTTIPKFLGAVKRYEALGDTNYLEYAKNFWTMVVNNHTYITGGNSEDEHFGQDNVLAKERTNCNCETCNTYNMLKLSKELFKITGDVKYADYFENTLVNAIMPSQNHETGMTMYFQPMASGYQKVFSSPTNNFWCCTGSGMENFSKLNDGIYFKTKDEIIVNQYISSQVTYKDANIKLSQYSNIQKATGDTARFVVEALDNKKPTNFSLKLRIPDWNIGNIHVKLDGKDCYYTSENGYITIPNINKNCEILICIPMEVKAYALKDNPNTYAFKYGPVVLSACLGTAKQSTTEHGMNVVVPNTKAIEDDNIKIYGLSVNDYMKHANYYLSRNDNNHGNISFLLTGCNKEYVFVPHYLQTQSYGIYFTYSE